MPHGTRTRRPSTPYELQKQLEVVADKLPDIYRAGTTLNIWLERETAQAS